MNSDELIKNIFNDIYEITGIKAALFDANMVCLYTQPGGFGNFCRCLRKNTDYLEQCLEYDYDCFAQCRRTGEIVINRCHMGLIEAAIPIKDGDVVIGYLQFGQLLPENARAQVEKKVRAGKLVEEELLLQELDKMEETEERIINASARLLSMCADYIKFRDILKVRQENLLVRIELYLADNLKDPNLSVRTICRELGISRGTLYNVSKSAFGKGITEHIRDYRLEKAEDLIEQGGMPIYRVAEEVGISDSNYLAKLIKKKTGLTPKKLQKKAAELRKK